MREALFIAIGLAAGLSSAFFGIGGGLIIVPALVYVLGFSLQRAVGTSLAAILLPVGAGAVYVYYKHGNVDFKAAILIAVFLFVGAFLGSGYANRISGPFLKLAFGVFLVIVGLYTVWGASLSIKGGSQKSAGEGHSNLEGSSAD